MDLANASMYDGQTGAGRGRDDGSSRLRKASAAIARSVHPNTAKYQYYGRHQAIRRNWFLLRIRGAST